jgi:hypothetical protein
MRIQHFKMRIITFLLLNIASVHVIYAQQKKLVAYVYEGNNRGLAQYFEMELKYNGTVIDKKISDENGKVEFNIKSGENFIIHGEREGFYSFEHNVNLLQNDEITYVKIPVKRLPGYDFEVLISEKMDTISRKAESIENTTTLVLNNTNKIIEAKEKNYKHDFSYKMMSGNHYSFLFSKEGYLTKRIEVNVNVNGCILCFTGLQLPQVAKSMTDDNKAGTISANMYLETLQFGVSKNIPNIVFDKTTDELNNSSKFEADKFALLLQDNANINIDLEYNNNAGYPNETVQKRILNFRKYLIKKGIDDSRISTKIIGPKNNEKSNYVSYSISAYNSNEAIAVHKDFKEKELPKIDIISEPALAENTATTNAVEHFSSPEKSIKKTEENNNPDELSKEAEIQHLYDNLKQEKAQKTESAVNEIKTSPKTETPEAIKAVAKPHNESNIIAISSEKYRVELMQLNIFLPIDAPIFKENPDVFTEKQKNKKIAYLTNSYPNEQEANARLKKIIQQGYNDAKVVKYIDGKRVE